VWILADEPEALRFVVAVDAAQSGLSSVADPALRRYTQRLTMVRVHQRVFRSQVLRALRTAAPFVDWGTPNYSMLPTSSRMATRRAIRWYRTVCLSAKSTTLHLTATSSASAPTTSSRYGGMCSKSTMDRCCGTASKSWREPSSP